jgi:hypothetical protein
VAAFYRVRFQDQEEDVVVTVESTRMMRLRSG